MCAGLVCATSKGEGMSATKIEWADAVHNPVSGCTPVSAGCANCYARRMAQRLRGRAGYPADDPFKVTLHPDKLDEPLHWRKPRRVFVCSMSDLFHDDVPALFIGNVLARCALATQHTFMVLTKRPERMKLIVEHMRYDEEGFQDDIAGELDDAGLSVNWDGDLSNVWLGVSISNQPDADRWLPFLLQTPAAVRFVSYEPALEMVDFDHIKFPQDRTIPMSSLYGGRSTDTPWHLNWIVLGGENGPGARPMHPEIPRSVRDQCAAADVPFFFKGWGKHKPVARAPGSEIMDIMHPDPDRQWFANVGKKAAGCLLDGREHKEMPGVG